MKTSPALARRPPSDRRTKTIYLSTCNRSSALRSILVPLSAKRAKRLREFLRSSVIQHFLMPRDDIADMVNPARYDSTADYIRAQFELFFG